jgi:hypothetical protein
VNLALKCALTAALIGLGGCNLVVSQTPMFTKADAAGAPVIRPGVWRQEVAGCDFDETLPQSQWPKCAGAQPAMPDPPPMLTVAGDPAIIQLSLPPDPSKPTLLYLSLAIRPIQFDAQGRVIALQTWPVQCGPPPTGGNNMGATKSPLPGLTMRGDDGGCAPQSVAALRDAAKASEAWVQDHTPSHWVRDPKLGDLTGPTLFGATPAAKP